MNVVLNIAYVGTNYAGWQVQPNAISVAEEIINAIKKVTGKTVKLNGSGRTDAGVHAYGQVANFHIESKIPAEKFAGAINHYLPDDIVINYSYEAEEGFHARFDATGKCYEYKVYNSKVPSPFCKDRVWQFTYEVDINKVISAAKLLEGTHDFKAFMASGSQVKDTVRTIYSVDVKKDGEMITITVKGNGFLYNMVRIIVGNLMYIGCGKMTEDDLLALFENLDRTTGAVTAPACGLYMKEVYYDNGPSFTEDADDGESAEK